MVFNRGRVRILVQVGDARPQQIASLSVKNSQSWTTEMPALLRRLVAAYEDAARQVAEAEQVVRDEMAKKPGEQEQENV